MYTNTAKVLKPRKFRGLNTMFVEVTANKPVGGGTRLIPANPE